MCSCKQNIFSLYAGINWDSKTKSGIVGVGQDYNSIKKWVMTAHFRAADHANFKDIYRVQETRKEK